MIIENNTVIFKSIPSMFRREQAGVKSNTVRILCEAEHKCLGRQYVRGIKIEESNSTESFLHTITDITVFQPKELSSLFYIYIFSWG